MERNQVMRQVMRKTGSVVSSAAARLALAAMALTVMAGCARVSTGSVQMSSDQLPRPVLVLVHDYQVSPDKVQLDSAISSRVKRAVQGRPEAEDQLKVEQEVSRALTTTLVDEIRKLGIRAEPAAMASPVAGPTVSIEGQMVSINEGNKAKRLVSNTGMEIGNSAALRPFAKREVMPGHLKGTGLKNFVRDGAITYWHQTCTAKMGPARDVGR